MSDGFTFDISGLEKAYGLLMEYSTKSFEQEFRGAARGIIQFAINDTPPARGKSAGTTVAEFDTGAVLRGLRAIDRDLKGVFQPVTLRGSRTITKVFGRTIASPVTVPTTERWPDVEGIHAIRNARRHSGRMTRGQASAYYVDRNKLEALREKLQQRVGWLAAGWRVAADLVGARMPGYAKGHAAPSIASIEISDGKMHFHFENQVAYANAQALGLQPRLQKAIEYQANATLRRIPHVAAAAAKQAGLKVA